jgi:phage shock protein PspC (stress-responsive transcriptional regulator)
MHMELKNRLYRSRDERMLAGVAGGIANYLDLDPTLVRLAWVLAAIGTGPIAAIAYGVCAMIIPREPETTLV